MAEKKIGSRKYRVDKLPATEANKLLIRLIKFLGPSFEAIAELLAGGGIQGAAAALKGSDNDLSGAARSLGMFAANLDPDETHEMLKDICEVAQAAGPNGYEEIVFEMHMTDLMEAYQLAIYVLQVQFRDFLPGNPLKT